MSVVDRAPDRRWLPPAPPYPPLVVGAPLVLAAVGESIMQAANAPDGSSGRSLYLVVVGLLALATTLPIALLWRQPIVAALVVSAVTVLSVAAFQTLTVAGLVAQVIVGYLL